MEINEEEIREALLSIINGVGDEAICLCLVVNVLDLIDNG
jgi:hypothetical protein